MDTKLILAALAVLALLGYLLLGSGGGIGGVRAPQRAGPQPPVILEIEFPAEIAADSSEVDGAVRFSDADGDLAEARFEVVEAGLFQGFTINLRGAADGITAGAIPFFLQTGIEQSVTLRVILIDMAGNMSEPVEFTFAAIPVAEDEN